MHYSYLFAYFLAYHPYICNGFFIFLSMSHVHNQLKRKKLLAEVAAVGYGRKKKQVKLLAEMGG